MQKAKGNHHKMIKTPEGRPGVKKNPENNPENNPEKLSVLGRLGRVAAKAAGVIKDTWNAMIGRDSDEQAKDISGTIAPEAPVKSGDTSPIANTMSEEQLKSLEALGVKVIATPEHPVYPKPSLPKSVTTPDGRQYPAYPKPSLPKSVTKPDGRQYPAEIEPPKPTPLDILINKRKDEARAAKYSSSVNPDVYTRVKGENVIDKDMFSTTIPNVDKPKKDDNPEGLTPYEQAMRYKYLGDEYDEAEYGDDEPEKIQETYDAATNLKIARSRFAKASVAVESHFFKKYFGGKGRQAELEAAAEQLKQSELEYMRLKFADKIEAVKRDPEKQAELAAEMAQAAFASMQETSRTTTDKYDSMLDDRGKFKKAAAKVGRWFNKGGRIAQWLKPGGAGFVAGTATGFFAGYAGYAGFPITTAVGAVTGLGFAGLTKQAVLEERRGEDRIGEARLETIEPSFEKAVANMKIDDVMEHAVNVSVDNLKDVSIERQDALHKKVKSSLGKYGIGFALGGVFGSSINHLWNNSAHATGTEGNADATPQSGGEQTPQSGGASSADNSAAKAIVDNINPDTSNFNSYDYPWDWAAEKFGNANAMDQLHNLADKAMANGHTVQWFNNPDGSVWMKVDGSSATADVLKVLNKYA